MSENTIMTLPSFYPIFDSSEWVTRLVPLGIKMVQLRIKDKSDSQLRSEISLCKAVCEKHDCILVINDYWQLAIEQQCRFVHLGQEDLDNADISAIKNAGIRLGISTHDEAELNRALELSPDYIALGPVYPTILKKMKWHQQGLERVTQWKQHIHPVPLVAIGGMNPDRALGAFQSGADIVSAVTDITLNSSPEARVKQWLKVCA
jgi:thiamine-phosphate pyrophosphorylase